ncbi:secreted protein Hcp [hydrothermal vent metagenome]|uniref:Secreted protein Hcp n=1 Tax=hydrothermal vent metagenome TaxID=652676 RepID=A0A1W1BV29_9ZZZZ
MDNPVYMSVTGSTQGKITESATTPDSVGNIYQNGHEDECLIKAFTHDIDVPRSATTGQATGQRTHNPLIVTKMIDKSSPLLFNAVVNGETLTEVELNFYRTSYAGKPEHYYSIILEDAIITNIATSMETQGSAITKDVTPYEKVSLSYRKISCRHETASTSGEDDWRVGVGA